MGDMGKRVTENNKELARLMRGLTAEDADPFAGQNPEEVAVDTGHAGLDASQFVRLDTLHADPAVPLDADTPADEAGEVLARHLRPMGAVGEYGPPAMFAIYPLVDKVVPSMEVSGIVGDTNHGSGYHRSRNGLKAQGNAGDYSIQLPADKRGDGNACTAIDLKFSARDMRLVTARLMTAFKPDAQGNYDPRIEPCREFFGTLNGTSVTGWNRAQTGRPVGYVTSDDSHLWHVHISVFRDYATDRNQMLGLAEVLAGKPAGAYGWHDPNATTTDTPRPVDADLPTPEEATVRLVVELDAPGAGNWQGAVQNAATKEWVLAEAVPTASGVDDMVLHRFTKEGTPVDKMVLVGAGHWTAFGVSDTNVIWGTWNEGTNDVVTIQYQGGARATKRDTTPMHAFSTGNVQVSFSPSRDWLVYRLIKKTTEEYRRYSKADVLAGLDNQRGKTVVVQRDPARVVQGFSLRNRNLAVLTGASNKPSFIDRYSFDTGEHTGRLDVTEVGFTDAERAAAAAPDGRPLGKREVEGMDGRRFCVKVWQGDGKGADGHARVLRVYETDFI